MITANIENLILILHAAEAQGCKKVKLQMYDNWEDIEAAQKANQPKEDFSLDTRYQNTVEFMGELEEERVPTPDPLPHVADGSPTVVGRETDQIVNYIEGDTLVLRVQISDAESLMKSLEIDKEE